MPCYQVQTMSVDLSQCGDNTLLHEALESLGRVYVVGDGYYQVEIDGKTYNVYRGKVQGDLTTTPIIADKIKRAYSVKALYKSAKRQGWQVKKVNERKYQIVRR